MITPLVSPVQDNSEDESTVRLLEEQVELLETLLVAAFSLKTDNDSDMVKQALTVFQTHGFCTAAGVAKLFGSSTFAKGVTERIW